MQYGMNVGEPINETARLFCILLKQKILTRDNLLAIQKLGYEIKFDTNYL